MPKRYLNFARPKPSFVDVEVGRHAELIDIEMALSLLAIVVAKKGSENKRRLRPPLSSIHTSIHTLRFHASVEEKKVVGQPLKKEARR